MMEGYSQKGFRPGRQVLIIKDSLDPENVGKMGKLEFSHGPNDEITFRGMGLYNPDPAPWCRMDCGDGRKGFENHHYAWSDPVSGLGILPPRQPDVDRRSRQGA